MLWLLLSSPGPSGGSYPMAGGKAECGTRMAGSAAVMDGGAAGVQGAADTCTSPQLHRSGAGNGAFLY